MQSIHQSKYNVLLKCFINHLLLGQKQHVMTSMQNSGKSSKQGHILKQVGVSNAVIDNLIEYISNQPNKSKLSDHVCANLAVPQIWNDNLLDIHQFLETPIITYLKVL